MNRITKYALITAVGNIALCALLIGITSSMSMDTGLTLLIGTPVVVAVGELIIGIVLAVSEKDSAIGAGILIGLGITLLIGLSVCGMMMRM